MRFIAAVLVTLIGFPPIATAQDWKKTTAAADRTFYTACAGGRSLQIGCFKGGRDISFLLLGGKKALFSDNRMERGLMVWIQQPDGRTARVPVDAEYLAGAENALTGYLRMGSVDKQFFANAASLEVDVPNEGGRDLFKTGMSGSAKALADILRTCPGA